jgi:nitrogen PTS system EIIA component
MYLNLVQIAESFGVSEKVVEGWIRSEGLPHTLDRGRVLFDQAEVANWAVSRGLAAHAGFLAPESRPTQPWALTTLLKSGKIWRDVPATTVPDVLRRVATALPGGSPAIRQLLAQRLQVPGGVTYAPVGHGFALPHPSTRISLGRDSGAVALLFLREGLRLAEPVPDEVPVTRLLFFLAPSPRAHLDLLARLTRALSRGPLRELLERAAPDEEIFRGFEAVDAATAQSTPPEAKA